MDMVNVLNTLSERVDMSRPFYVVDGLEYCAECNTPRQRVLTICGEEKIVNMMCKCAAERREKEEQAYREYQREQSIRRNISVGLGQSAYKEMTFDKSDEPLKKELAYCRNFSKMLEKNCGIIFTGGTGAGKTFRAGCIANELLRSGYTVYMDSITSICSKIQQNMSARYEYINDLCRYDLLILDDIGAERKTEYMSELVYSIIDGRYNAEKPLIVTTNITLTGLKTEGDINCKRAYDRIIEMCPYPIVLDEGSRRRAIANEKYDTMRNLLEGGNREVGTQ